MTKVDNIIKENPNLSLDDLVAARKINVDQKAQALKKPALQAQLAQYEDQLATFRKIEAEHQAELDKERSSLVSRHAQELESTRNAVEEKAAAKAKKVERSRLLLLSRFLAAAADRRNNGEDTSEEGKAFEGVLLLVYGGDSGAVAAMEKLIDGVDEKVCAVDGMETDVTCESCLLSFFICFALRNAFFV